MYDSDILEFECGKYKLRFFKGCEKECHYTQAVLCNLGNLRGLHLSTPARRVWACRIIQTRISAKALPKLLSLCFLISSFTILVINSGCPSTVRICIWGIWSRGTMDPNQRTAPHPGERFILQDWARQRYAGRGRWERTQLLQLPTFPHSTRIHRRELARWFDDQSIYLFMGYLQCVR
jgi:hypothetical protein